ncbi:3-dehydroquinate synthase [Gramella sp. AN32]|uniref:3-dehydroquinate synthase n=1 Tax=Christiangramia antarctica TaxID=2058158 RepID=A0ABW5XBR2_9FLAO|nr:3-dehydroquinate synthase [Gramella sp. AN32]MCM4157398.1 3-dehydroquinate synthase [Gramella sp. AN32]
MKESKADLNPVYYAENGYKKLNDFLKETNHSKIFVLVDANTHIHCLSKFLSRLETSHPIEVIEIDAGEEFKNLETCEGVWNALSELEADRKALIINLGGGVVTDLGGFVASAFKRGIAFVNIPTTLLSMVDASVGGKTGVDLGNLKNQIGFIVQPEMVLIDSAYLETLPTVEMRSGLAEILKHGLIADENYWEKVSALKDLLPEALDTIIKESVEIKKKVVQKDPYERNIRKTLNYGHTLGHAIESYLLTHPEREKLLHGEAIAIGMILETYISAKTQGFPEEKLKRISAIIKDMYQSHLFSENDIEKIQQLMKYDKKNEHGKIQFVLLKDIGEPVIDCQVSEELVKESFHYYLNN